MKILMSAILVLFFAPSAQAEQRVALVFGADRYDTIRPLENAVNDARAIEKTLTALDFEVFFEPNRDLRRMRRALENFEEDAAGADVALVFFAGHGVEIAGENRLMPTDADASSLEALRASTLSLNGIQEIVSRVAKSTLIVLDACRSDPFARVSDPNGRGLMSVSLPDVVMPGLGRMGSAENTLFAFSAAPGETASDGEGENSPFTSALVNYLGKEGLEIRSVLTLVQQEVYDRTRGRQLPYVESGLPSLFFAAQTSTALPERERLLLAMAEIDDVVRQDVERVAQEVGTPLAPLYGALIGSDLGTLSRHQRSVKLREAASAFTMVRDQLRLLRSEDDGVTALRQQAEEQLQLGAFDAARASLTKAAAIDADSRETLKANLVQRTLSEATTHYLNGGAAQVELRYQLALADHEKAIALFDEVDDAVFPSDFRIQQLNALGSLGQINITIGNLPGAAAAFQGQLEESAAALNQDSENTELQYILARAHDNLGDVLFEQGKIDEAMGHFRSGHEIRLALSVLNPGDLEVNFALSNSYHRLGQIYHRQGDLATAERLYRDKLELGSRVVALAPPGYRWQRDLSLSDERLGDILRERGDFSGALARYRSSLERMTPIRNDNPGDLELSRFTSITLDRMGEIFADQGDLSRARSNFEESRALRETLVAADPANVDWLYVLGISHERIGDLLLQLGETEAATKSHEAKHEIATLLAASDPTNVRWLRDLSVADERLANLARGRGELDLAKTYALSSLDRMRVVKQASPSDKELTRFVSFTQDLLGHILLDEGNPDAALELYQSSLEMRRELVQIDPENADWKFILGVSHELIGNTHMRTGEPTKAADSYALELRAMSQLLDQDPENTRWARAVSVTNELLGDALLAAGDRRKALDQYEKSLERMSAVRDANPDNLSFLRFTAITSRKIGNTYLQGGARDEALAAFQASAALAKRLVAANPENGWWLRDLLFAQKGVFDAGGDPKASINAALRTANAMIALGVNQPSDDAIFAELHGLMQNITQDD